MAFRIVATVLIFLVLQIALTTLPALSELPPSKSKIWFYGAPATHFVSSTRFTEFMQSQWGLELDEPTVRGGSLGVMWQRTAKDYGDLSIAICGTRDSAYQDEYEILVDFRAMAYSMEAAYHKSLNRHFTACSNMLSPSQE